MKLSDLQPDGEVRKTLEASVLSATSSTKSEERRIVDAAGFDGKILDNVREKAKMTVLRKLQVQVQVLTLTVLASGYMKYGFIVHYFLRLLPKDII